jgi:hypothetical protein
MDKMTIIARQLRLAVVTNVYRQGLLTDIEAREILSGPLSPDDESTIYDDSDLLGDPDALEKIATELEDDERREYEEEEEWYENDCVDYCESAEICPYCGEAMIDDMEVGQGYHCTAPCYMWATGQIAEALEWEKQHDKR